MSTVTDMRQRAEALMRRTQDSVCSALCSIDDSPMRRDHWERPEGGGGESRILQDGKVFEKAGVNVSVVHGNLSEEARLTLRAGHDSTSDDLRFFAAGISLVIHPHNPMAPTAHANFRYFERGEPGQPSAWWFGGGADLTPAYLFEEDAQHFHRTLKQACDAHDLTFYPHFKRWCDKYFYLPHRQETRGVGGIFFDDLHDRDPQALLCFVETCANAFVPAYFPLVQNRHKMLFTEQQKKWQGVRRGRYVEFNLMYDRGTLFGLKTGGRIESILMSLPLQSRWEYAAEVHRGSPEEQLVEVLRNPREWV